MLRHSCENKMQYLIKQSDVLITKLELALMHYPKINNGIGYRIFFLRRMHQLGTHLLKKMFESLTKKKKDLLFGAKCRLCEISLTQEKIAAISMLYEVEVLGVLYTKYSNVFVFPKINTISNVATFITYCNAAIADVTGLFSFSSKSSDPQIQYSENNTVYSSTEYEYKIQLPLTNNLLLLCPAAKIA